MSLCILTLKCDTSALQEKVKVLKLEIVVDIKAIPLILNGYQILLKLGSSESLSFCTVNSTHLELVCQSFFICVSRITFFFFLNLL